MSMRNTLPPANIIEKSTRQLSKRRAGRLREPRREQKVPDEISVYFCVLYLDLA